MIDFENDLLARWRTQIGTRRTLAANILTRRAAAASYLTYGPPACGMIEVDHLVMVMLYDERIEERWPKIQLAGFTARRTENGVQWGGVDNNCFFKDLALVPRWGAQGQRLDLAKPQLLELGLALDEMATQSIATQATYFHLPRLWAGFRAKDAHVVERDCPELDRVMLAAASNATRTLKRVWQHYFGLTLLPYQWVTRYHHLATAVFADLRQFPKLQAFQLQRLPAALKGSYGSVPYDFSANRFARHSTSATNGRTNGRSHTDNH